MLANWSIPPILTKIPTEAGEVLAGYFGEPLADGTGPYWSGAMFERFAGGGDADAVRNRITADDLTAVSMLGVNVPADAALRMLDADAEAISRLLAKIPTDLDLVDATDKHIGRASEAWKLWKLLREYHSVGPTITSKSLARKWPRLLPVQDSRVVAALHHESDFWASLHGYLNSGTPTRSSWLRDVGSASGVGDDISEIRVFDILVWIEEHRRAVAAENS